MSNAELEAGVIVYNGRASLTTAQQEGFMKQAQTLMASNLYPGKFKNAQQAFIAALYGHELGLSPQRAWKQIHVIQGIPAPEVHLQVTMVRQAIPGLIWNIVRHDQEACVIEHGRTPESLQRTEFTYTEAQTAGLAMKDNWKKDRKGMLYCRCAGRVVRWHYPETQGGGMLHNDQELMDGEVPAPATQKATATATPGVKVVPKKSKPEIEEAQLVDATPAPATAPEVAKTEVPRVDAEAEEEKAGVEAIKELREALTVTDNPNSADYVYGKWREAHAQKDPSVITEGYKIFGQHMKTLGA